jgi:tetratricopeptide (TPR) repeat protein
MYACKQCGTGNSLDSSFCKKCGAVLPTDEIKDARTALASLLEEGNALFTEGRTDEAILIAEMAVQSDPSSHVALSLKGLCHDRLGQIAEALECYEAAVALNPDSTLDKIKVAALRNKLAQHVTAAPEPNRRGAAILTSAAVVLVLVVGSFAGMAASGHKETGNVVGDLATPGKSTPLVSANTNPTAANVASNAQTANQPLTSAAGNPGNGADAGVQIPSTTGRGGVARNIDGNDSGANVPPLGPGGLPDTSGYKPVIVSDPPKSDRNGQPKDPDPGPIDSWPKTGPTDPGTNPAPLVENRGSIDLQLTHGSAPIPGGSQSIDSAHGAQSALRAADTDYQLRKYAEAANHYRQVADMGGDTPRIQQRLGECFTNLGQIGAAKAAYNRAISKYQAQIKSGQGIDRAQRGLDSCEQALKVIGG